MPKKYHLKTFGCQMNFSDSERIEALMSACGYLQTQKPEDASLVIFNTCGVRQTAEDRLFGQVHNLRKKNPKCLIFVTGCLALRKDVERKMEKKVDLFVPVSDILELPKYLQIDESEKQQWTHYLELLPNYKDKGSVLLPIMTGCNNFCSYCVVPYARGREWSRPASEIFEEIEKTKPKKVVLLGQNVNSYSYEQNEKIEGISSKSITFPVLLDALAKKFPQTHFGFLTSHPKDFSKDLIKVIANNKNISREIHLPVQAGSDKILAEMNRKYTKEHYLKIIAQIKKQIPDAKISTDIIVGFPGETEEDFNETVDVFEKVGFFEAYINKYSPRPGTAAEELGDPISWDEKKQREKKLRTYIQN